MADSPLAYYDGTFLNMDVLQATLQQAYHMFRFFHGPMETLVMQYSVQVLRSSLEIFFPPYLANLDFSSQDILDVLDGVLPLHALPPFLLLLGYTGRMHFFLALSWRSFLNSGFFSCVWVCLCVYARMYTYAC